MNHSSTSDRRSPEFLGRTAVVMPALNEEACIAETVRYWLERRVSLVRVVDNGSSDHTSRRAGEAGAEVLFEPRRGYGAAAWRGTVDLPSKVEWILFCSGDGSDRMDAVEAAAFQAAIDAQADLVLGERVSLLASRASLSPPQRMGNALGCRLLALGWGHHFQDMGSLRVIRRCAFERLRLEDRAFGWNVEMQIRAMEQRLRIVEVPVRYYLRSAGAPKISGHPLGIIRAGWGILSTVTKFYATRRARERPYSYSNAR